MAPKKGNDNKFFSPLSFIAVFESGIRDKHPGSATLIMDLDPDSDPYLDLHQDKADPHADPAPSFTHVGKYDFFLLLA
jgi:hypothetical protein